MITTIRMETEVRDRLRTFGTKGETYEQILIRLMDNMMMEKEGVKSKKK